MNLNLSISRPKIDNGWKIFAIIFMVNILQSVFTPLSNDEPYYLLYARYLSWGYFDHPPMIGLLIRMGTILLPGELGFRLFCAILGSFTFFFTYRIIESEAVKPVNYKLAALLIFSSLFLNLYTFLALPDTPLLCFAALFLYAYRRYTANDNLLNTLIIAVVAALMLYAKYHGVLLIGFTVLSNINLLKKRSFYLVMLITILLMAPHIYWQIQHGYPSIRFQLFERNRLDSWSDYKYLPKQLALTGPVILLLFSILYKPLNQFQKALKYNVIGIFTFFLLSSFSGFVNMHWTAIAWPPMLCLSYLYIVGLKKYQLYVKGLLLMNLAAIIVIRLNLVFNWFPLLSYNEDNPVLMSSILKERSKGYPLVFDDMYNDPTFFMFYQHQNALAVNNVNFKKTQFNYLPQLENQFQGKTVCYISYIRTSNSSEKVVIPKGKEYYITFIKNFTSFNTGINVKFDNFKYLNASAKSTIRITVDNELNDQRLALLKLKGGYLTFDMLNKTTGEQLVYRSDSPINLFNKGYVGFSFTAPAAKGNYMCNFAVVTNDKFLGGFNSNTYIIKVK